MQRDSAVPRPIQRNINATAADLDMNWRRGAPAPAPAPAARAPRRDAYADARLAPTGLHRKRKHSADVPPTIP